MKIVTIMDYATPKGIAMRKAWIYLATRTNPTADILILHGWHADEIVEFGRNFKRVAFERLDLERVVPTRLLSGYVFRSQHLTLAGWVTLERLGVMKFLFAEADAWIVGGLDEWWAVADEKPYIGVLETIAHGGPYLNTGTYSYNSRDGFLTYGKLFRELRLNHMSIPIPVGDQGLINLYFRRIGYDWQHPKIGEPYNCHPIHCEVVRADDEGIEILSGKGGKPGVWEHWPHDQPVKILHPFADRKWSDIAEVAPLVRYVNAKVAELEE